MILDSISSRQDLLDLSKEQLASLCQEIRERLINTTSKNGGHLGPNLGVVELTVALHLSFETPNDSICWDVSHQGYVHKLLTGRKCSKFDQIRQSGGYSGFLSRKESKHDAFGAGHAGTALSAALGMCVARDLKKASNHVVAVAGDAAFTCGITLEALNNIATSTKRFILIINDNEWSIAKNVGAFSRYFNDLITNPIYSKFHKEAENILANFPGGSSLIKLVSKAKRDTKELLAPSSLFEKLGLRYLGPIDGHDIDGLVRFFEFAKQSEEPIVLHVLTKKGKGFPVALQEPEKWHGSGPFDPKSGKFTGQNSDSAPKYQDVFGSCLVNLARENKNIVGITAAMPSGTGIGELQKHFPERFIDVGIAEEHAVLLAAGLATQGFYPVCAIYSTFLQRAYDQIVHDVCLQELPVTFCLDRAGLSPNDGPTHHGLFDISYLRCIPNAVVMQPAHEDELQDMLTTAIQSNRPCFIRYPRGSGIGISLKNSPIKISLGKADLVRQGSDLSIWALGDFVQVAEELAMKLDILHGISCSVVNARFVKPLDENLLLEHASEHRAIITLEDNVLMGGFGSSVLEVLSKNGIKTPSKCFGWPDQFVDHGNSVSELRTKHGLDSDSLFESCLTFWESNLNISSSVNLAK